MFSKPRQKGFMFFPQYHAYLEGADPRTVFCSVTLAPRENKLTPILQGLQTFIPSHDGHCCFMLFPT
jgi:hypothetical protein